METGRTYQTICESDIYLSQRYEAPHSGCAFRSAGVNTQAHSVGQLWCTASAMLTGREPCAGFLERLPPCSPPAPEYPNPHNRVAVCCAALDVCCQKSAHASYPLDAAGADDNGSDGSMSYQAHRTEKLALLRAVGLACDEAPAGGPSTVWVTQDDPLPTDLERAAQVCHASLQGCAGGFAVSTQGHGGSCSCSGAVPIQPSP